MVLGIQPEQFFLDTRGLYALLSIVPLIILYLIKPKPQEKKIPSLMFIMRDMGAADRKSFFKRFAKDWLFWIQLLTLILLSLAVAKPFVDVPEESLAGHSVIVLDISASMQTDYDGRTRFEAAKEEALNSLGSVNSIILAKNVPVIAKDQVDKDEAREFLKQLEPSATSTAIYDAARSAMDYANENTRVIVLSDFIETEVDNDVNTVKKALSAKGAIVRFKSYSNKANNIGIVDVVVKDDKTSVQVRNYFQTKQTATIKVGNIEESIELEPGAADVITFSTPKGVTQVNLEPNDNFPLDNQAFISTPKTTEVSILFITNDDSIERTNLWVAFKAINEKTNYVVSLEKAVPPRSINVEHDVIVLKEFDTEKILPGVFRDIQEEVEKSGAAAIISAQKGMFGFQPLQQLLPVTYNSESKSGSDIVVAEPEIERLTKDVNFGHVDYYFNTKPNEGARPIATAKRDNSTVIAYQKRGPGSVFYYGIFDQGVTVDGETKQSTFKTNLFYPIFWKRVLDLVTETPSVDTLNRRTGEVITLPEGQEVETPTGGTVEGVFHMERQGIYTIENREIAANLINSKESDVAGEFTDAEVTDVKEDETVSRERPKPLTQQFIIAGIILLMLELIYTKFRGDM